MTEIPRQHNRVLTRLLTSRTLPYTPCSFKHRSWPTTETLSHRNHTQAFRKLVFYDAHAQGSLGMRSIGIIQCYMYGIRQQVPCTCTPYFVCSARHTKRLLYPRAIVNSPHSLVACRPHTECDSICRIALYLPFRYVALAPSRIHDPASASYTDRSSKALASMN